MGNESGLWVAVDGALLREDRPAIDVAVWCNLHRHINFQRPMNLVTVSTKTLMRLHGRDGRTPTAVSRATGRLEEGGWLVKKRVLQSGTWRTFYELFPAKDYVELPIRVLDMLQATDEVRRLTPELLRSQLRWMDLCGRNGHTRDTLSKYVETFPGERRSTAGAHRRQLVKKGLLLTTGERGRSTQTRVPWLFATRPGSAPYPARIRSLPGQDPLVTQPGSEPSPDQNSLQETNSRGTNSRERPQDNDPIGPSSTSVASVRTVIDDERRQLEEEVAVILGCTEARARQVLDEVHRRHSPRDLGRYVRRLAREGDLRKFEFSLPAPGREPLPDCEECGNTRWLTVTEKGKDRAKPCSCNPNAARFARGTVGASPGVAAAVGH